ncbi:SCO6880 family protein [Embleya sp. NPDC001921]
MNDATKHDIRTYGNWRKPISPGLGKLGFAGTVAGIVGILFVIIVSMFSFVGALVVGALIALSLSPMMLRDKHGRNGFQWMVARGAWAQGKAQGQHLYRSGPLGRIPMGTCKLPGLIAASTLHEARDAYGRPFAIITVPSTNHHTVVLTCSADGASLVDDEQVDVWVAYWGLWLSQIGHEPGIAAASVTIESAPDTGERLRSEVELNLHQDAPSLAKQVLTEVTEVYGRGSAQMTTRVALTYSGAARGARGKRTAQDMAIDLGMRLPGLCSSLQMTGAGPARPMTGSEMKQMVRIAYDPSVATFIDRADQAARNDLRWDDAGPTATEEGWGYYRHDSAYSVTWAMSEAPRGEVYSNVLSRLVGPHPDIMRKRVTLLYRPHNPATSAHLVERDRKDAVFKARQSKVSNARDSVAVQAAEQAAREEATGAGLVRFAMLITATVQEAEDVKLAASAIDNLTASSRILVRRVYGSQASAFAAALPLGLVLPQHLKMPQSVREAM